MHAAAHDYIEAALARHCPDLARGDTVIEFGSHNVNGTVRDIVGEAYYLGLDVVPGPGVDAIWDCSEPIPWSVAEMALPPQAMLGVDLVVCAEVLEHTVRARDLVRNAGLALHPAGVFIMTCAGPTRPSHSAIDGGALRPDEWYQNVLPEEISLWLEQAGFSEYEIDLTEDKADLRATGLK